jgi:amino acid adenylation domain-containing protein
MSENVQRLAGISAERRQLLLRRLGVHPAAAARRRPDIPRAPRDGDLPLSFAQQRLWFLHQLAPASPVYNIPFRVHFSGPLAPSLVARAMREIVGRHEALRTRFVVAGERPVQVVAAAAAVPIARVDLEALPPTARARESARLAMQEARRPFDLERAPLLRLVLVRYLAAEHLALITMHHLVSDGWSVGLLIDEFAALYGAWIAGTPPQLPDLPIQYADFARWQRQALAGDALAGRLAFWRATLAGAPHALELPTDRPRPAQRSLRGAVVAWVLPPRLTASLASLGRSSAASLFAVLCAAFGALLARYTGQEDLVVGTAVANRDRIEIERLIGFFVNMLALRLDCAGDPPFVELLARVREVLLGAQAHQDLPFEKLVEDLAPERALGRTPLVQVALALQNAPGRPLVLSGLRATPLESSTGTAKLDLTLGLHETADGGLGGRVEYATDLFDRTTVCRLLQHLETLLAGAAAAPAAALSELPLLPAWERCQLLVELNDTARGYPRHRCLHELFAAQALRRPDVVAVTCDGRHLTYRELYRRSNQLARRLRRLGAGPEVPVAVGLERSLELVVGVVGVLASGAAYLPLAPSFPRARLALVLAETGAPVLITGERRLHALPPDLASRGVEVLCLDSAGQELAGESDARVEAGSSPDNLAYVMYTSGSTGEPKGVGVTHRAVARLVFDDTSACSDPEEVWLHLAPLAFDASTLEIWGPLTAGARLVLFAPPLPDLPEVGATVERQGVTSMLLTTSLFHRLAEGDLTAFRGLRRLLVGGEALSAPHALRATRELADIALWNCYGPTEGTVIATCQQVRSGDQAPGHGGSVSIGRPIANGRVHLRDRRGLAVPIGVPGELSIGGDGLARGYFGRPELTAERFVPDPGATGRQEPGARLYRTGDLARCLPGGTLEFLGRIDQQVKLRGFRIEPREIEAALEQHPAVREAAVVAQQWPAGSRDCRLVAYVVARPGRALATAELRGHLRARLPEYMVPAAFVSLPVLPLTTAGKLDRRALPEPETRREGGIVAPRTPLEEVLATIWCDLLGVTGLGVDDDFFDAGGHSLLATQVMSRLRAAVGIELGLQALFASPTVAGLARQVEALRGAAQRQPPPLVPAPRGPRLPLSFAQQRLWFLDQVQPGNPVYNLPLAVQVNGRLRPEALAAALAAVIARHECLRTTLVALDGQPEQRILPAAPAALPQIDLGRLPEPVRGAEAARLTSGEAIAGFALERGPLVRSRLLRLGAAEHRVLVTMHHAVSDGWSLQVFMREVVACYRAAAHGVPASLPRLEVHYADYACWQRQWLSGEVLAAEIAYWRRQLAGLAPVLELPADRPRPPVRGIAGAQRKALLPPPLSRQVLELARRQTMTPFMVLLAAFAALLGRLTGQRDLALGVPIAGRNRFETEGLIGFFVNTLVLRTDLTGGPGFVRLLDRVRAATLEAYAHQDLPFERVVEELAPERGGSYAPLVQVSFAFQQAPPPLDAVSDLAFVPLPVSTGTAKFDLTLSVIHAPQGAVDGEGLAAWWEYATDLFDGATIGRFTGYLTAGLEAAIRQPERDVWELPLLAAAERHQLLVEASSGAPLALGRPLLELLAEQVQRTPEAVAVACGPACLTYAGLEQSAARLARRLVHHGVGPERLVAVLCRRGAGHVAGMLAIWKAGGAYLPLDPFQPPARLVQILAASGAAVVLATSQTWAMAEQAVAALPGNRPALLDPELQSGAAPAGGEARLADPPATGPWPPSPPDGLAYVLYTSGSTGIPKGAMIDHRGLLNHLLVMIDALALTAADVIAQTAAPTFDISIWQLVNALLAGGRVEILVDEVAHDPARLAAAAAATGVTVMQIVPSLLRQLLAELEESPTRRVLAGLRWLLPTGEALPPDYCRRWLALYPEVPLLNAYGPTECADDVSLQRVSWPPASGAASTPIGRAVPNLRLHVVDGGLAPAPTGVSGELVIGGIGVGRGYLGQPDLTAELYLPDPFAEQPGARLFRTGDLVRRLADGNLDFLGRRDHLVKVRGFRIELGEIEAALRAHSAVAACAVVACSQPNGDRALAAYVVPRPGAAAAASELLAALAERLPGYMIPAAVVFLPTLPLSVNGKLDRRALPPPAWPAAGARSRPRTPHEEILAAIWSALLERERIGTDESFFAIGGHSLLAIRLVSKIRQAFGVELPLRRLFDASTIAELAAEIEILQGRGGAAGRPPVTPVAHGGEVSTSFAQQRQWLMAQLDADGSAHHLPVALRASGPLRPEILERALAAVVARHESLRTSFPLRDGLPVQAIAPTASPALPLVDLRSLGEPRRDAEALRLAAALRRRSFALEWGPLLRAALLRLQPRQHVLIVVAHHLVVDGWSLAILAQETVLLCRAFAAGKPDPLPPAPLQYADYAAWERRWLTAAAIAPDVAYWREQLAAAPAALELPLARRRGTARTTRGGSVAVQLPQGLAASLVALGARRHATLFMTLVAGFQALLCRLSGQEDVVIGAPVAGRGRAELEGIVGYFINALPLRTRLDGDPSWSEILGRVREVVLGAYAHQDVPFERLVQELLPRRRGDLHPFFQIVLNFYNGPVADAALDGIAWSYLDLPEIAAKYDLTLYLSQEGELLLGSLAYNADLFEPAAATRIVRSLEALLGAAADAAERRLSELPILTAAERLEHIMDKAQPAKFDQLMRSQRQPLTPARQLVSTRFADPERKQPLLVEPVSPDVDLLGWARANLEFLESSLLAHGAVLLRGFHLSLDEFQRFARTVAPGLVDYVEGSSPRILVGDKVYTSTEYPPELTVSMHNELSYAHKWPRKIMFFCVTPPQQGGETPIADSRTVFDLIAPAVRERFLAKGVRYVRNLRGGRGAGLSWESVFETADREFVEAYCRAGNIDFRWQEDGGLWTSQVRPAAITHPATGESVWFNQVHQFHPSNLGEEAAKALLALHREQDLPVNATYGDGTPLEDEALAAVRAAYQEATIAFPWQEHDLLLMDNMLMAHGRRPFGGPRRIVVAMGDPVELAAVS